MGECDVAGDCDVAGECDVEGESDVAGESDGFVLYRKASCKRSEFFLLSCHLSLKAPRLLLIGTSLFSLPPN